MTRLTYFVFVALALNLVAAFSYAQSDAVEAGAADLDLLEEQAIQAAVARVAPAVVRIETVGGAERIGNLLVGGGATTGLIVSSDGYIVSSTLSFTQKPASILVTLPGAGRATATLVATDHSRMLVLLKVNSASPLPTAQAAPQRELRPGQWALALGRTYDAAKPNLSAGIVSAVGRIWGKAVQTDAKISPVNYGGPLVDIHGRVIGVLSPLSSEAGNEAGSAEWYDSGIGFAVPLEHILSVLPRLKEGNDLHPGLLGISFKGVDIYADEPILAAVQPSSPAGSAGLKPGDKIVEIAGKRVRSQSELKHQLSHRYGGDKVSVVVARGEQRLSKEIELVAKLPPYEHPFIGILPEPEIETPKPADAEGKAPDDNDDAGESAEKDDKDPKPQGLGIRVRYVYPDSPAAKAGLQLGDVVHKLGDKPASTREEMLNGLANLAPRAEVSLAWNRNGEDKQARLTLASLPTKIPAALPKASPPPAEGKAEKPAAGVTSIKIPELKNECAAYIPASYDPRLAVGLIVWLSGGVAESSDETLSQWKAVADEHGLIVLVPQPTEPGKWQRSDAEFLQKAIAQAGTLYTIDEHRIAMVGREGGGALAAMFALATRPLVRGLGIIETGLPSGVQPPANDPVARLAIYVASSRRAASLSQSQAATTALRRAKYPVTVRDLGPQPRPLNQDELSELARWVTTLDRL